MSEIVEDYRQSLTELTFNSRPIIDTLTTIAKENTQVAEGILGAIINRIYKCLPEQKLFALYLLDSICKTVGNPYNELVGHEVFKLFSHVYLLVEDNIRVKLQNLFETWKLTKSKGTNAPLFPSLELDKIANFLKKAHVSNTTKNNKSVSFADTTPESNDLTNNTLIKDIDELIPVFRQKLNSNSNDLKLKDRYNALHQLKLLLQNQPMQFNELKAVQNQLINIRQQELNNLSSTSSSPTPPMNVDVPINKTSPNKNNNNIPPNTTTASKPPVSLPQIPINNQISKANEVFDQLINYGIITFEQQLNGTRNYDINYPKNIDHNQQTSSNLLEHILSSQIIRTDYERAKYNELSKLKLSSKSDVSNSTNLQNFISNSSISIQCKKLLYDTKGLKCSICGKRFNKDNVGQNMKRLHLDWHFRINKKLKTSTNVQSRNWYLDAMEWVKFKEENLLEFQVDNSANVVNNSGGTGVSNNSNVSADKSLTEMPYVIIPSDETNMNNKCLICREQVKGTFNEDLGEWCWPNCIIPPGEPKTSRKIVHATCYNETRKRGAQDDLNSNIKREKV